MFLYLVKPYSPFQDPDTRVPFTFLTAFPVCRSLFLPHWFLHRPAYSPCLLISPRNPTYFNSINILLSHIWKCILFESTNHILILLKKIILIIQQPKLPNVYLNGSSTTWHTNNIWFFECRTLHLKCSGNNKHEAKFIPSSKEPVLSTHYVMGTPVRATGTQILLLQDTQLWCDHSHKAIKMLRKCRKTKLKQQTI